MQPEQKKQANPQADDPALGTAIERPVGASVHLRPQALRERGLPARMADIRCSFSGSMPAGIPRLQAVEPGSRKEL